MGTLKTLIPYSEYLTRLAWLQLEWNDPSRTDHYLMQIAMLVHNANSKSTKSIDDMKLPFGDNDGKPELTREEAAKMSKARWRYPG